MDDGRRQDRLAFQISLLRVEPSLEQHPASSFVSFKSYIYIYFISTYHERRRSNSKGHLLFWRRSRGYRAFGRWVRLWLSARTDYKTRVHIFTINKTGREVFLRLEALLCRRRPSPFPRVSLSASCRRVQSTYNNTDRSPYFL
jgi:hypothetical protein